jgi:hypothetical protein
MKQTCNLGNLYAAVRATAWPALKGALLVAAGFLSLAAVMTVTLMVGHPEEMARITHGAARNFFVVELVGLVGLIAYGLFVDKVQTILKLLATVIAMGIASGVVEYVLWLGKTAPEFGWANLPAIFELSNVTWGVRFGLLPMQLCIGLLGLASVVLIVGLIWGVLSNICDYGARVRAQQPQA